MASNELIQPSDRDLVEKKMAELGNAIVVRANDDRKTAKDIYDFIQNEIAKMEDDYQRAKDVYDTAFQMIQQEQNEQFKSVMLCKLGKPPYKKNIVSYIEQLNRALEMSIKSSDSVTKLLDTIAKVTNSKKVNIEEVNIDNRNLLLEKVIEEEQQEESIKLNNIKGHKE